MKRIEKAKQALFTTILFLCTYLFTSLSFAQPPCPPFIDAGNNQKICKGACANLSASFLPIQQTTAYGVTSIPFSPPVPFNVGTPVLIGIDDIWSGLIPIPFTFCFYGNAYNQLVIGSNGLVSFEATYANSFCPWSFTASVPNSTLPLNAIFGVYHDIDPSDCGNIRYTEVDNAPCRRFVISFDKICHYWCHNIISTTQIVLYETTNLSSG